MMMIKKQDFSNSQTKYLWFLKVVFLEIPHLATLQTTLDNSKLLTPQCSLYLRVMQKCNIDGGREMKKKQTGKFVMCYQVH